jgi:hypothetical protein
MDGFIGHSEMEAQLEGKGESQRMNELNLFWFFCGFGVGWAFCLIISLLFGGGEGEN